MVDYWSLSGIFPLSPSSASIGIPRHAPRADVSHCNGIGGGGGRGFAGGLFARQYPQ